MYIDWVDKWLSFCEEGQTITLHGVPPEESPFVCAAISLDEIDEQAPVPPDIHVMLEEFADVFEAPTELPPRRSCEHTIPLITGARPVAVRPYRIAPLFKDELEKQIKELLKSGMIRPTKSPFSSPVLLVKKKGGEWRLVVNYIMLNAITIKGKFPVLVIDELLDEFSGAAWFTKLDLRAGYHQIRLAEGEEYKTTFQTHLGHYEFSVLAFGLSCGPGTFQGAMNTSLAPVNRENTLVFFDDILIFNKTYQEHLAHIREVLAILRADQWKVKLSKYAFAQEQFGY